MALPRRLGAAGLLAALLVLVTSLAPAVAADEPGTDTAVSTAVLRWGLSNEASNAAFAPNTYNFFSAGKVPDPGVGGRTLKQADWRQSSGAVAIEKWSGTAWRKATWAGLSTAPDGSPLGSPTAGRFSTHQVVLSGGTGEVDAEAGTATLSWTGDFTVLLYSGMSFFYVSDPVLEVADGVGRLTGTLSGFASSQTDTSTWEPVAPHRVTLADLPDVELSADGFTALPAYAGVSVTGVDQATGGASFGSFPQSWVDFMDLLGTAAYWLSSGASTDAFKPALPVTVSLGAGTTAPTPSAAPSVPTVENEAPTPPAVTATSAAGTTTSTTSSTPTTVTPLSSPAPAPAAPTRAAAVAAAQALSAPVRLTAAHVAPTRPSPAAAHPDRPWWLAGTGVCVLALLIFLAPWLRPRMFHPPSLRG